MDTPGSDSSRLRFGQIVEGLRIMRLGCSARALSLMVGKSESYIGKLEKGEIDPSLSTFAALAKALHLSPQEMWFLIQWSRQECHTEPLLSSLSPVSEVA